MRLAWHTKYATIAPKVCYFHCTSAFSTHTSTMVYLYGVLAITDTFQNWLYKKTVIREIKCSDFYAHTSPLFKSLEILKIKDLFNHKIGSLMWDFDHQSLPDSLASMFTRRDEIHNRNLRDKNKNKLYIAHRFNNKYWYDSFSYSGSVLLNKLKDLPFYGNCYSKSAFMAKYKAFTLDTY